MIINYSIYALYCSFVALLVIKESKSCLNNSHFKFQSTPLLYNAKTHWFFFYFIHNKLLRSAFFQKKFKTFIWTQKKLIKGSTTTTTKKTSPLKLYQQTLSNFFWKSLSFSFFFLFLPLFFLSTSIQSYIPLSLQTSAIKFPLTKKRKEENFHPFHKIFFFFFFFSFFISFKQQQSFITFVIIDTHTMLH